ncbi:carbon-nitrogen family hydrolase [Saccharopolyspora erythraea]|uniref:carbon-nitrogen family hydrolase n=1 Tax=Saccharopolyspora erythraea TaxID=1836 RepID=UPI001BACCA30|nr:carbon-nitrogen family hydrolase [Saccharopolyspora erythraea]QUH03801.1 carbon-nitrogen family hydrolase [Saccharopolyspora erythraea]
MRATLVQLSVSDTESAAQRRTRAAGLVRGRAGDDIVVLPELWTTGAWDYDAWQEGAEPVEDGPTARIMSDAARSAGVWLHAGTIVERDDSGALYNTALVFDRAGALRGTYRKIHRYGFDTGEAVFMAAGRDVVAMPTELGELGLAICYDLRFPELFRALVDAGTEVLVVPSAWPAHRREQWRILVRARAVEEQAVVLACCAAGTHAGMRQAGGSLVVDPWGEVLAEAGDDEEVITADVDVSEVRTLRADLPVLGDRILGIAAPAARHAPA